MDLLGFVSASFSFFSSLPPSSSLSSSSFPSSYWSSPVPIHPSSSPASFSSSSSLLMKKRPGKEEGEGGREGGWVYVAHALQPVDDVSVSFRRVEVAILSRGGRGEFVITTTGLPSSSSSSSPPAAAPILLPSNSFNRSSSSGSNNSSTSSTSTSSSSSGGGGGGGAVSAAINVARVLLLKHQQQLCQLLGPPTIDLRTMTSLPPSLPPSSSKIDIHVHLPHCLPSAAAGAYALPAFLALLAACWPGLRDSLDGIGGVGELNCVGALSLHSCRLPPSFVSSLPSSGVRKVILPRAQACELVRRGEGVGDRWVLGNGVLVVGAEGILDAVRCCFLGDDGI